MKIISIILGVLILAGCKETRAIKVVDIEETGAAFGEPMNKEIFAAYNEWAEKRGMQEYARINNIVIKFGLMDHYRMQTRLDGEIVNIWMHKDEIIPYKVFDILFCWGTWDSAHIKGKAGVGSRLHMVTEVKHLEDTHYLSTKILNSYVTIEVMGETDDLWQYNVMLERAFREKF